MPPLSRRSIDWKKRLPRTRCRSHSTAACRPCEVTLTEYPKRDFSLVDVCRTGTTKGTGLAALAGHFGVEQAEVMAVGDNHNDRDMLEWAGTGVVMGNAEPALKIPGFHLTGTNDEAGLAQAIDLFIP